MTCEITPNPGKIIIYTSGCPKNQNKCWYKIGSPPPACSKNEVLKFLSVKSIVIAPAKTGKDSNNKTAVSRTDHTNNGSLCIIMPGALMLKIVVIKFTAPNKDETPATCKLNMAKSTEGPECAFIALKGG